jgi:hypothetical protein
LPRSSDAKVLARESPAPDVGFIDVLLLDLGDVPKVGNTWESFGEHRRGVGVELTQGHRLYAGALKALVKSTHSREERGVSEAHRCPSAFAIARMAEPKAAITASIESASALMMKGAFRSRAG